MRALILISLMLALPASAGGYQLVESDYGYHISNHTNHVLYCYIGAYEFSVPPNSVSRAYPHSDEWGCY